MNDRQRCRRIQIGSKFLGGSNEILIQSMCSIKTSHVEEVVAQINRCASLGADLMRLSCLDEEDARAFALIKKKTSIPLIADIHFDYRLALLCLSSGVDAIRINPGNIGSEEGIAILVEECKKRHVPIRVGVNSGSLDKSFASTDDFVRASSLVASAKKHVAILEKYDFHDIVISLKGSSATETIEAYRLASSLFPYPLHLGVTEAGPKDVGLLRSAAALAPLLLEGIGSTIRISLSDDPEEEILAARRLLKDLHLREDFPNFISCPTCGRTQVNLIPVAKAIQRYCEEKGINKTIAIMGCIVNGPGEASHADLGAAGGNGKWAIFKKGTVIRTVPDEDIIAELQKEIDQL